MDIGSMPLMPYSEAMRKYGNDKPDTRFGMTFVELKNPSEGIDLTSGKDFRVFDSAELIAGICMEGGAGYTRKQLDERSEEHTSELQSLMRISYAVFCLKKK